MAKSASVLSTSRGIKLGILGGGQLARMIALEAPPMGIEVHILSENADDPAAQVVSHWTKGNPKNLKDLKAFLKGLDVLTFESEFFDMDVVDKARPKSLRVYPETSVMRMVQDRRTQKAFLDKYKLPTSKWMKVESADDLKGAWAVLGYPFVLKKSQGGYDGYGTFFMKKDADVESFLKSNKITKETSFIAEKMIKFKREVAVMAFRSNSGHFAFYPWVETRQTDSKCDLVLGPLHLHEGEILMASLKKALAKINYVGAIGIEAFELQDGSLLINELAPRVHNSGHYSQEACSFSQFALHLQSGVPASYKFPELWLLGAHFVMANLLGQSDREIKIPFELEGGRLHWYGKKQNRRGRKMGHMNFVGENLKVLEKLALKIRKKIAL